MINIFCIFLAVAIILPAITEYYMVPPAEILKDWSCAGRHELCKEVFLLDIQYGTMEGNQGSIGIRNTTAYGGYDRSRFTWQYDKLFKEITLYEPDYQRNYEPKLKPKLNGWKIKLRVEITAQQEYLFNWDETSINDTMRLIELLELRSGFMLETAKIEKIDNNKTIRVFTENNSISLILNDEKTKVTLNFDNVRPYEVIAKMENNKLNIYDQEYHIMTTYYIDSSGKTPIDAKLFDGVTWTTGPSVTQYYN